MRAGLDHRAVERPLQEQPDRRDRNRSKAGREQLVFGEDQPADQRCAFERLRHPQAFLARAPDQADQLFDNEGGAECEEKAIKRRLAIGRAQAQLDRHAGKPGQDRPQR